MRRLTTLIFIITAGILSLQPALAQQGDVEIQTIQIKENIYMLQGPGGNIGVMVGEDGVFMIDDQFSSTNEKIMAAIAQITGKKVKFLINTHWHNDHTGGNELMGKAGSIIVAHKNVRKRLTEKQVVEFFNMTVEPLSKEGLPVITFTEDLTFHYNGDEINVFHVKPAHTDGDAAIYFKNANVLHSGDIVFSGVYPFIDYEHGGSAEGYIPALDRLIGLINDNTKVIPGHGAACDKQYLIDFREMLSTVTGTVKAMMAEGKSLDEVVATKPTAKFDEKYAGFIKPDDFVALVYKSLK